MRDTSPVPQPEDTGTFWVDCGGVATIHSPPSTPTAQESSFSPPVQPTVLPRPANLGLPTDHLSPRRPNSRPSPAQHLPPIWAESPLGSGEPSLLPGPPWSFLLVVERFLHVSPDPSLFLRRRASTGVTWVMPCRPSSLANALCGVSSFSQLGLVNASTGNPRSSSASLFPRISRLSTSCRRSSALCISGCWTAANSLAEGSTTARQASCC